MYLGVDIGGTKTLVASLDEHGVIKNVFKFSTPKNYLAFKRLLATYVAQLSTEFTAGAVGIPGRVNRLRGTIIACGNLPWVDTPIKHDLQIIAKCPIVVENDANLAALSEAMLLKQHKTVLYLTISTGIGMGVISNAQISPMFRVTEGGQILLEHGGKLQRWEDFASGRAIHARFGMSANDITSPRIWRIIAHDLAIGIMDIVAIVQPDIVILGGGVSNNYEKFIPFLQKDLQSLSTPLTPLPLLIKAQRPNEAVIYGCYDLVRSIYG